MSGFDFRRSPDEPVEDAWGSLQRALHRWVLAHGGSKLLARTAAWASLADAGADAALALAGPDAGRQGMRVLEAGEIDALRREAMVGDGRDGRPTAFVIDAQDRFYLWRNHGRERAIESALRARRRNDAAPAEHVDEAALQALFGGLPAGSDSAQRAAVRQLSHRRFGLLTGGPGTGKTSTVLRMLLMAQHHRLQAGKPPARIAIAAPTGKAAQRLQASLQAGRRDLLVGASDEARALWQPVLDALPATEAQTLHGLLGYRAHDGRFGRDREQPLEADIVVIDEASMLDLALLEGLLVALPEQAQLFLVGDADQLTSIGTGSVLLDLVAALEGDHALVRLQHGFRTHSRVLPSLLASARSGDGPAFHAAFDGIDATWHRVASIPALDARLHEWAASLAALPALRSGRAGEAADALAALDALRSRQLLCALRDGDYGALRVNAVIERDLRRQWRQPAHATWYPGRAVMVTRNDYATRLFNGDVGVCLAGDDGTLRVWFETASAPDGSRQCRAFSPAALPAHESAFAITVHKSQGSEYADVALLLPPSPAHRILTRQLLYTGLSRASDRLQLWSGEAALDTALASPVRRVGGLQGS